LSISTIFAGLWNTGLSYWNSLIQYGFEFEHPERLWYIVPLMLVFLFFLRKDFVILRESTRMKDANVRKRIKVYRILMLISRSIIFLFLVIALAGPILNVKQQIQGERSVTILVDKSDSMDVYDTSFVSGLQGTIQQDVPASMATTGSGTRSNLGDGILANIRKNSNLLLITDGNANTGSDLGDAALFAADMNASISVVDIQPVKNDYSVTIDGPAKVLSYSDATFTVTIKALKGFTNDFEPKIIVDGTQVYPKGVKMDENTMAYEFSNSFTDGQHKIEASTAVDDYFASNNHYYKTVKSVPKPKLLFVSRKISPIEQIFSKLYDVEKVTSIPDNLDKYYAAVIDDMPAAAFSAGDVGKLSTFLSDGNGLIVFGGDNSFEYGKYQDSQLLSILPVTVGVGDKQPRPDLNAVVVIDISEGQAGFDSLGLAKAHSVNILSQFRPNDNVGAVAFSQKFYTVSGINKMFPGHAADLTDKIQRLNFVPASSCSSVRICSNIIAGMTGAENLLQGVSGKKWIFLYSDGQFFDYSYSANPSYVDNLVETLKSENIVAYSTMTTKTKVGDITYSFEGAEQNLRKIAESTGGIYFPPSDSDKMRLLFGNQGKQDDQSGNDGSLTNIMVLNRYHFITEDMGPTAKISGFNQIVPKSNGQLLMTTSQGDPLLIVWRYGVGRVAVFGADDGTAWAGQVLNKDNSKLISRMINWGIGDPERKLDLYTQIYDGIVNETNEITVKSFKYPTSSDLSFYKIDDNLYSADFRPDTIGFGTIANNIYASNYPLEYQSMLSNPVLSNIVSATDGKIFKPSEADQIVDFVNKRSERVDVQRTKVSWPFVIVALFLFLIEVLIRRIDEQIRKD